MNNYFCLNYVSTKGLYADRFADDFNHGVEVRDVVKEDMILVQFSSDAPNASLRYWTTIDEANGISTIEEYMDKMALSKEWGNPNVVKVARVKKGTEVTHAIGTAKAQTKISDPRPGNGKQILFIKFDSNWITEVRNIKEYVFKIMKKEIMKKKLNDLQCEIRKIQDGVDDYTREYLIKLEKIIEEYKNKLDSNKMNVSDGGTLGLRRAILEDDNLANIDSLYNAAVAVDKFYSQECREW